MIDRHHLLECILWPNRDGTYRKIINTSERLKELGIYDEYKLTIQIEHGAHSTMHWKFKEGTEYSKSNQVTGDKNPMYGMAGEKAPMYGKGYLISGSRNPCYGRSGDKHPLYGRTKEDSTNWKGDSAKPGAKYRRALKEYRRNPTEENLATLEEARLRWNEYQRFLKATSLARTLLEFPSQHSQSEMKHCSSV